MDEQIAKESMEEASRFPWLLFRVKGQDYAVNSRSIVSISTLPEDLCPIPNAPEYMRGYFYLRDNIVPLYDLRTLFGQTTMAQEYQAFTDMLEQRKQDHLHWVEELKASIREERPFSLATDPHQCAFGKWYDSFHSELHSISHHLAKIDEPHKKLHRAAEEVRECTQECDHCVRSECLKSILTRLEGQYVPLVVGLLDEAKAVFRSSYREMVVVVEQGETLLGLVVDEVLVVEHIDQETLSEVPSVGGRMAEGYTMGVARRPGGGQVLLLDQEPLFALC